ncbi:MAG: 3-deoxy-manno-octulosonate cytidylyltransferase [Candidatus Schekmanbacteria bacterium GWA2_38_11]|uniref:3-deoxy-manno-octulosonate cytidylyltransferase n=1 Tax=Candidatus Schekmanbacteria bacterium GWA2_38_11 TaxID=1817876 RepID=A0A1F7REA5_9BACT|nr:MAG: 3-deoxy-manno-octulosonate cytidylyltransferase [Candidatus Schekmanbacteria bacterium GWA2_38_11]
MKSSVIIPVRYESTRFQGKPLAKIKGKTMIQHVYERASKSREADKIIVATDDERIYKEVKNFGGEVKMTSKAHASGTDRVAEVAKDLECNFIVNLQGDEPLIDPSLIDDSLSFLKGNKEIKVCTFKKHISDHDQIHDPNVVKVVVDGNGFAIYFSRFPIPFPKGEKEEKISYYKHIGLYTFEREFLLEFSNLPPSPLEKAEGLEQLRILENGYKIKVLDTEYDPISVDIPDDIKRVEEAMNLRYK